MKQKVVTRAIIRQGDKVLLLRRKGGRPSIQGYFELPGGRVYIHQQAEDSLAYALKIHLGVRLEAIELKDVMTFVDPDDRQLQYVFIVFDGSLSPASRKIALSDEYDKYVWKKLSDIQLNELTQSTQQLLGLQVIPFTSNKLQTSFPINDAKKSSLTHVIGYCDGGSRGNPGPAASGYVLLDTTESVIAEGGAYIGNATNNIAEYKALYLTLERAVQLGVSVLDMRLDSLLVVNQMNGIYAVKNHDLLPVHRRIQALLSKFERITFTHVPREHNTLADGIVNKILDQQAVQEP